MKNTTRSRLKSLVPIHFLHLEWPYISLVKMNNNVLLHPLDTQWEKWLLFKQMEVVLVDNHQEPIIKLTTGEMIVERRMIIDGAVIVKNQGILSMVDLI